LFSIIIPAKQTKPLALAKKTAPAKKKQMQSVIPGLVGGELGSVIGGALSDNPLGAALGGVLGKAAGGGLAKLFGHGDYKVKRNSLSPVLHGANTARFMSSSDGIRITHREFVGDISGSTDFQNRSYFLNPSDSGVFPWLSTIASRFAKYRFDGILMQYIPSSSAIGNATNASLGTVVFATNYNVTAPPFDSKLVMEASEYSSSGMPCDPTVHTVECAVKENVLKTYLCNRIGNEPTFTEFAHFQLATKGMQSVYKVGELWIAYDVVLYDPLIKANHIDSPYFFVFDCETTGLVMSSEKLLYCNVDPTVDTCVSLGSCSPRAVNPGGVALLKEGFWRIHVESQNEEGEVADVGFSNSNLPDVPGQTSYYVSLVHTPDQQIAGSFDIIVYSAGYDPASLGGTSIPQLLLSVVLSLRSKVFVTLTNISRSIYEGLLTVMPTPTMQFTSAQRLLLMRLLKQEENNDFPEFQRSSSARRK
jgi:hypothetical protein